MGAEHVKEFLRQRGVTQAWKGIVRADHCVVRGQGHQPVEFRHFLHLERQHGVALRRLVARFGGVLHHISRTTLKYGDLMWELVKEQRHLGVAESAALTRACQHILLREDDLYYGLGLNTFRLCVEQDPVGLIQDQLHTVLLGLQRHASASVGAPEEASGRVEQGHIQLQCVLQLGGCLGFFLLGFRHFQIRHMIQMKAINLIIRVLLRSLLC